MIYLFGHIKGGAGKSTASTNFAARHAQNKNVLFVDADPQQSSTRFFQYRDKDGVKPSISCMNLTGDSIYQQIPKFAEQFDDVIIDAGGRDAPSLRAALVIADLLIVPVCPSEYDVLETLKLPAILNEFKAVNPAMRAAMFINQADPNPQMKFVDETIEGLKDLTSMALLKSKLCYRSQFRRTAEMGMGVNELPRKYDPYKSNMEMFKLYEEIMVFGEGTDQWEACYAEK